MKKENISVLLIMSIFFLLNTNIRAQDPNFYIYLCFGQSNMEGHGIIEAQDTIANDRFLVFQAISCDKPERTKENWYPATPPTCQCNSKLSLTDQFGKTMIKNLPDSIKIGIINVAVGGCDIRLFDKDLYQDYDSTYTQKWFTSKIKAYEGNPYKYMIDLAKLARKDGVIKGILLHQGETNNGDELWPSYVKKIYEDILNDLELENEKVPLLAGELLSAEGSCCSDMNDIINKLPLSISNSHVISSKDCPGQDQAHFNSEGYRMLGERYALKMLYLQDIKNIKN